MIQLWVNLPSKFKMTPPRYQSFAEADFPVHRMENSGITVKVIAGSFESVTSRSKPFSDQHV